MSTCRQDTYRRDELKHLHELPEGRAYGRAREHLARTETEDAFWHEGIRDNLEESLDALGFGDAKVHFSGFYSQGDGAHFAAKEGPRHLLYVDVPVLLSFLDPAGTEEVPWPFGEVNIRGRLSPRQLTVLRAAEGSGLLGVYIERDPWARGADECAAVLGYDWGHYGGKFPHSSEVLRGAMEALEKLRLDLCGACYTALREEYAYLTGRKHLEEVSRDLEVLFTEDGDEAREYSCGSWHRA